jgi:hypothetical protein
MAVTTPPAVPPYTTRSNALGEGALWPSRMPAGKMKSKLRFMVIR